MEDEAKKTAEPKRRFPEFRTAWTTERMGKLYSFLRNNALSRDKLNYKHGTVKNIHYGDIHTKFSALFDITKERVPYINSTEDVPDDNSEDYCVEGDLILADASEDTNDVGKCIELVRLNGEQILSGQHTILARQSKPKKLLVGFAGHLFRSGKIRSQIQKEAQGTKVYAISSTRLGRIDISYPVDEGEQQKIADCLTSVDEVIAVQGRKVAALKDHKKGLMQRLFPREGETIPSLRFPEFRNAGGWEEKNIGDVFDTATGGTPDRANKAYWNGEIPWVTTSLVNFNIIRTTEETISAEGLENSAAKMFPRGTVLMALYGQGKTRGQVAMLGIEATTNQACAAILPCDEVDSTFTFLNLSGRYDEIRKLSNSGGQENLSQGLLREMPFCYPKDPAEQQRIADCLSSLDARTAAESKKLNALKNHKKGLMQQLFRTSEVD